MSRKGVDICDGMVLNTRMELTNTTPAAKFIVGATYEARSACDHNAVWSFTVIGRTAKFITVNHDGEILRVGVKLSTWSATHYEYALPFGSFSMAPTISAAQDLADRA